MRPTLRPLQTPLRYLMGIPGSSENHLRTIIIGVILLVPDSKTRLKKVTGFLSSCPQATQPSFHVSGSLHTFLMTLSLSKPWRECGKERSQKLHSSSQRAHFGDASKGWHMNQLHIPCTLPQPRWLHIAGAEGSTHADDILAEDTSHFQPRGNKHSVQCGDIFIEKGRVFFCSLYHLQ